MDREWLNAWESLLLRLKSRQTLLHRIQLLVEAHYSTFPNRCRPKMATYRWVFKNFNFHSILNDFKTSKKLTKHKSTSPPTTYLMPTWQSTRKQFRDSQNPACSWFGRWFCPAKVDDSGQSPPNGDDRPEGGWLPDANPSAQCCVGACIEARWGVAWQTRVPAPRDVYPTAMRHLCDPRDGRVERDCRANFDLR